MDDRLEPVDKLLAANPIAWPEKELSFALAFTRNSRKYNSAELYWLAACATALAAEREREGE